MFHKRHPQAGARPGTLLIGSDALPTRIRTTTYAETWIRTSDDCPPAQIQSMVGSDHVTWIDVQGFANEESLQSLAEQFGIHPLAMEDVVNIPQRPKCEAYSDHVLIIARSISPAGPRDWRMDQISIIVGRNYVITFHDGYNSLFDVVRRRLECDTSRLRGNGADYLAYALLDTAIDGYYPVLEYLGELLEHLEQKVISHPQPQLLQQINSTKNRLTDLRRTVWPQRDAVQALLSGGHDLFGDNVTTFLRDTYDHCVQTADVVEMYREMSTGLLNTYMSAVAHRANEIMKVLTIMSSIFVPMTFVAGIYGMNFQNMPELNFAWSYPLVWILMLSIASGMLLLFHRKGWISVASLATRPIHDSTPTISAPIDHGAARVLEHDRTSRSKPASGLNVSLRRAS